MKHQFAIYSIASYLVSRGASNASAPDNALPNDLYDEFLLRGNTPTQPGALWFKVVQTCTKGVNAWVEVPTDGTSTKGLKSPAALLEVLDIQPTSGHKH